MLNTNINNSVILDGIIVSEPMYSHEMFGEKFYACKMEVERTSGFKDVVPLTISNRLFHVEKILAGLRFRVIGQFRSFNHHTEDGNRLVLSVFAREIEELDDMQGSLNTNDVSLDGYICKEPVYRKTPNGREIADILLAVNRSYGKSDYIPCICWGRNARYVSSLEVGTRISVSGRIQSREYEKRLSDTESEIRVAYEVSVSKIDLVEENTDERKNS